MRTASRTSSVTWTVVDRSPCGDSASSGRSSASIGSVSVQYARSRKTYAPAGAVGAVERLRRGLEHLLHGAGPAGREDDAAARQPQDRVLPDGVGEVLGDLRRRTGSPARARTARWGWPGRRGAPSRRPRRGRRPRRARTRARTRSAAAVYGSWSRKSGAAASRSIAAVSSSAESAGQVRAEVGRLHHARAAAGHHQPAGPGQLPAERRRPAGTATRRAAPRARPSPRPPTSAPCAGLPAAGGVGQRVVDAVVVQPLRERLPDLRQRAAVRPEVLVDHGVVHRRRSRPRRSRPPGRRRCRGASAGSGTAAPGSRAPRARRAGPGRPPTSADGEAAADEERVGHVDGGEVGHRVEVEAQPLHGQPGEAAGGQVERRARRATRPRRRVASWRSSTSGGGGVGMVAILPLRPRHGTASRQDESPVTQGHRALYRVLGRLRTFSCSRVRADAHRPHA